MHWHNLSIEETLKELEVKPDQGLSINEVRKRQQKYGRNILEAKKKKSLLSKFIGQFADFMIIVLICAAIVSLVVSYMDGNLDFVDPVIIFLSFRKLQLKNE